MFISLEALSIYASSIVTRVTGYKSLKSEYFFEDTNEFVKSEKILDSGFWMVLIFYVNTHTRTHTHTFDTEDINIAIGIFWGEFEIKFLSKMKFC